MSENTESQPQPDLATLLKYVVRSLMNYTLVLTHTATQEMLYKPAQPVQPVKPPERKESNPYIQ